MVATFKALSALLGYPTPELVAALDEIEAAVGEPSLRPLLDELRTGDLYDLQAHYVELFDRSRRLSLNLFEHVHGESRDRGQAMVDLAALYAKHGLAPATGELPDYLPLFLEFLSTRPLGEAQALLADAAHILAALHERLARRGSAYASVLAVLATLAGQGDGVTATDDAPEFDDLRALDAAWEEAAVTFGPGDIGGCPAERLGTRLRAAGRDVRLATV